MNRKLFDAICEAVKDRAQWADRQAVWYQMRRDGLRRRHKPFPGAADMHFPLIDTVIEKFKPFYINQLFATERLADFVGKDPQAGNDMTACGWWFDYKLKQQSNLEREIPFVFDTMLQNGRGICKVTWDAEKKQVRFDAIEPVYLIVPADSEELQTADFIVHVQHFSPWKYQHGPGHENRRQDAAFVARIKGSHVENEARKLEDAKKCREGITHSANPDQIILWEVYSRQKDGWRLHTISPACPGEDVRPAMTIPYKHGLAPFVEFTMEETDKSYYSPRGVAEKLAAEESSLCKMWNEKHDAMTYYNRPLFYAERDLPNTGNIRMRPGDILPFAIKPVPRGEPPMSWDQEMINTRMIAEQRIAVPDFGTGQIINTSERKTAREVDAMQATMSNVVDMRARLARRQLGALYRQAWEILIQYDEDLEYLSEGRTRKLEKKNREQVLSLKPNGSSESWNPDGRLKKAIARKGLLGQSPFVNQAELDKSILELDEPGLVQRLFRDPGIAEQDQVGRIMRAIPALELGLSVEPLPDDDDAVHASFLLEYMARNAQANKPASPDAIRSLQQRLAAHMQRLGQTNPKAAKELQAKGKQILQVIQGGQQAQQTPPSPDAQLQPQGGRMAA